MVDETEANTFNNQSSSLIKLNNGTVLYLREVNKFLALVCILREENFQKQGTYFTQFISCLNFTRIVLICISNHNHFILGVIDYNFLCFRDAITQVFELRNKCQNAMALSRATSGTPEPLPNGAADSVESTSDRSQVQLPQHILVTYPYLTPMQLCDDQKSFMYIYIVLKN